MTNEILTSRDGEVVTITLNRPEKLNAWTGSMRDELIDFLHSVKSDRTCHAVILTGAGRGFCAGQDLAESAAMDPDDHEASDAWIDSFDQLYRAVRDLPQVSIAALNGVAAGSGFQFALTADLRVGDPSAHLGQPEVLSGIPSITGIWAMWSILGRSKTTEFALTGELVDAEEAHRLGLLNYVSAHGEALREATGLAHRLAGLPQGAMGLTKGRIRELEEPALAQAVAAAKQVHRAAYATGEPQREMRRFLDKKRKH
jgi:enoyl-CoA hydratase/carnithine racemase